MKTNINFNDKRLYTARFHNPNVGTIEVTVTSNNIEHYEDFCRLMSNVGLEVKDTKDWMDNWLQFQRDNQKTINIIDTNDSILNTKTKVTSDTFNTKDGNVLREKNKHEFVCKDGITNHPVIKVAPPKDEYIVSVTPDGNNPWIDSHSIIWMDMSTAESFNKTYEEIEDVMKQNYINTLNDYLEKKVIKDKHNSIWMTDECGAIPCKAEDSIWIKDVTKCDELKMKDESTIEWRTLDINND